ncbi:hypothetical protein HDV00_004181 [Rhizophlyctis rosea]|nr:hypothetical protein HDV00_004181 [Rhizophlyctis rosea]
MAKALLLRQAGPVSDTAYVDTLPNPTAGEGEVVVKVHAAAVNPADWKLAQSEFYHKSWPAPFGFDISGTVADVGPGVTGLKAGDEVFGKGNYAFAEVTKAPAHYLHKKPSNFSHEQASTVWVGLATAIASLFSENGFGFPRPQENQSFFRPEWILITGGATSVGLYAIQLAAASGYSVITTASKKHESYLQTLGALHVIDYHQPRESQIAQIKEASHNRLSYALDIVGETEVASQSLSDSKNATLVAVSGKNGTVKEGVTLREVAVLSPSLAPFIREVINDEMLEYLEQGRIQPNKFQVVQGGLEGVKEALKLSQQGSNSGEKLVVAL